MIEINRLTDCCGCSACASVCPKQCISMQADEEGFLYPMIDSDKCVNCRLCEKVCPVINEVRSSDYLRKAYILRTEQEEILIDSTSGGFFTPLAKCLLDNDGIVCAAAYDNDYNVSHSFILPDESNTDQTFEKFRGSKYVQSDINQCYGQIKKYLANDKTVCFVGTACQVYGLKCYLQKDYSNLFTVDLVCHGTPSPKQWKKYLDYQRQKHGSNIKKVSFRSKKYGYHNALMEIQFVNGKKYFASARTDFMLKSFFREIASRPICYQCPFKKLNRCSDLTVYDCWHVEELLCDLKDDNKGFTNVIAQSHKGEQMLNMLYENKYIELHETEMDRAVELDGVMIKESAVPHPSRSVFYKDLDQHSLKEHINMYLPVTARDYLIELLKKMLYKTGLLRMLKSI